MDRFYAPFLILLLVNPLSAQVPELDDNDNRVYYGKNWGASGIIEALLYTLSNYNITDTGLSQQINNTLVTALDGIWNARYTAANGSRYATWSKIEGYEIYPSQKYGSAGIIPTFLSAYNYFGDEKYLEWANESIRELYFEQEPDSNYPSWPYSYVNLRGPRGVSITDINFGSLGIIDATLDYYEVSNETDILDLAISAANWIYSVSYNRTIDGRFGKIIPWYAVNSGEIDNAYSAYYTGNAGALPILSRLAALTGNQTWQHWADFIALWLRHNQKGDGRWTYSAESSISDTRTNLEEGVAGTIMALYQYIQYSQNISVIPSISSATSWLEEQFTETGDRWYIPYSDVSEYGYYGLFNGFLGDLRILRLASGTSFFISSQYKWFLDNILFDYWIGTTRLIGLVPSTLTAKYSELSYAYGLGGVLTELVDLVQQNYLPDQQSQINDFVHDILYTLIHYQQDNGLWPRQVSIPKLFNPNPDESDRGLVISLFVLGIFGIIGIIIRWRRSTRKSL